MHARWTPHILAALLGAALAGPALAAEPASDANSKVPAHQKHPVDAEAPQPTGRRVELKLSGGGTSPAYLAEPRGPSKGALLIVHEWWGLNDHIKAEADRYAQRGYLALAVDLYGGKVAKSPEEAQKLMGGLDEKGAVAVEKAGLAYLKANGKGAKIATIGWCMGGGQSLNASLADPADVAATIIYYGMPVMDVARLKTLEGPVLGIWARKDGWINPEKVAAFDKALTEAGVPHEFHSFDADHAFANPTGGRYNPPAAKQAQELTDAFLAKHLGG